MLGVIFYGYGIYRGVLVTLDVCFCARPETNADGKQYCATRVSDGGNLDIV